MVSAKLNKRFAHVPTQGVLDVVAVGELRQAAAHYARKATTDNTRRCYAAGQAQFRDFCAGLGVEVFPGDAEVISLYLAWLAARYKPATVSARLSAVRHLYGDAACVRDAGVRKVLEGILRTLPGEQEQSDALTVADLDAMCGAWAVMTVERESRLPEMAVLAHAARNMALVRVGFMGAFRRSELAGLNWNYVSIEQRGALITLTHEKTQQRRLGRPVAITRGRDVERCPVAALERWREVTVQLLGRATGPVFRRVHWTRRHGVHLGHGLRPWRINAIVQEGAALAGLSGRAITAHSLRVGFVTAAAEAGLTDRETMRQSRHRSHAMVTRYVRPVELLGSDVTAALGM